MDRKEPVSNWQAFWLVFLSVIATTAVILLAGAELPVAKRLWSQEAAGWASAVGTFAAALVALWLAGRERRQRREDRLSDAKTLADAICDELRAVYWSLANLQSIDTKQQVESIHWARFQNALQGLITPVLDRVHGDLANFETTTAAKVTAAYGNVLRFSLRWNNLEIPTKFDSQFYAYAATIRKAQESAPAVQRRVEVAIWALWPMTSWPDRHPFDDGV